MSGSLRCPLAAVEPGAELAADACDSAGRLLYPAGTILDEAKLAKLGGRDIEELEIRAPERSPEEREAHRRDIEQRLTRRFRNVAGRPLMDRLRQLLLDHRLERGR